MVHQETCLKIQLQELNQQHLYMVLYVRNPISKLDGSVFSGTGKPVARSDEVNKDTSSTQRLERTSSTWKSPSHAEEVFPQSYMVEHHRLPISELHVH